MKRALFRTRIKFCGRPRAGDVRLAGELGVDAIGLIFAAGSPRRIEPEAARALLEFMRLDHLVGKLADELATHPEWLPIPLFGILRLLDADATGETPTPYNE